MHGWISPLRSIDSLFKMTRITLFCALFLTTAIQASAQGILGVYVANQGNFSANDGSITWYDLSTGQAQEVLGGFGTLAQSITLLGDVGYVASNTSNAVDILSLSTHERVGQIPQVASPRYLAAVSQAKAYVSELYSARISVLDLQAQAIAQTIVTGTNPEDIAVVGSRAFVANSGFGSDSTLTVIDTQGDTVLGTIDLGCDGPRHLEVDAEGELWAFCNGNTVYNADFTDVIRRTNGAAVVLDPATGDIIERIDFDHQAGASSLGQDTHYSPDSGEVFLIRSDSSRVLVFDTATNTYKESITLPGSEPVGGLAYDAATRRFYVGRIVSFTTPGFVQILNRDDLMESGRFEAGVAPAHLVLHRAPRTTAIETTQLPGIPTLAPAYPNPFTDATTLTFSLELAQRVSLVIYDALGREVARPVAGIWPAGEHRVVWEAGQWTAGVYYARLTAGGRVATGSLVLSR